MKRLNWLDLSEKLVDRFDMDFTQNNIQLGLGQQMLGLVGKGLLVTPAYPVPFPIILSGASLGGSVGTGFAVDANGQIIQSDGLVNWTATSDPTNPRWSLLVLRYKLTGDTPVAAPSDPINTVNLYKHDDFDLVVIPGTPAGSPAYPSPLSGDVVVMGLKIPAGATLGTSIALDPSVQDRAFLRCAALVDKDYDAVVGSVADVLALRANYSSLQAAHDALSSGSRILFLATSITENCTFTKAMNVVGKGRGSVLDGTLALNAGSSFSTFRNVKFGDNITINSASVGNSIRDCWLASGKTITASRTANTWDIFDEAGQFLNSLRSSAVLSVDINGETFTSPSFTGSAAGQLTLVTAGGDVLIKLQNIDGFDGTIQATNSAAATLQYQLLIERDGVTKMQQLVGDQVQQLSLPGSLFNFLDTGVPAGSHTYRLFVAVQSSNTTVLFQELKLVAKEIV